MNQHDGAKSRREPKMRMPMGACACGCDDTLSLTNGGLSRRKFMASAAGAATLAATGFGRAGQALAQSADTKPYRIDVHHHLSPPTYIQASVANNFGDGLLRGWTVEKSLADMDQAGIAVSMLSVTQPGVNFTTREAARKLVRE